MCDCPDSVVLESWSKDLWMIFEKDQPRLWFEQSMFWRITQKFCTVGIAKWPFLWKKNSQPKISHQNFVGYNWFSQYLNPLAVFVEVWTSLHVFIVCHTSLACLWFWQVTRTKDHRIELLSTVTRNSSLLGHQNLFVAFAKCLFFHFLGWNIPKLEYLSLSLKSISNWFIILSLCLL